MPKVREGDIVTIRLSKIAPEKGWVFEMCGGPDEGLIFDAEIINIQHGDLRDGDVVLLLSELDPRRWEIVVIIGEQAWIKMADPNFPIVRPRIVDLTQIGHFTEGE